jgi:hypothetical protein
MQTITFAQYLNSREQLVAAIESAPKSITEHVVTKYCGISLGESEANKYQVFLRPGYKVLIEWRYDDINNPTPINVQLVGSTIDDTGTRDVFWSKDKLNKWLGRHTK